MPDPEPTPKKITQVRRVPRAKLRRRFAAYRDSRPVRPPQVPSRSRVAVPSFFTLMNLLSGFVSIIQASEGHLTRAAWLIVLAAFFDLLDGLMARLAQGDSAFGIELDSLSDLVSFGVAPAFLVYQYGFEQFGTIGVLLASLPAVCGAVRLARFNVESDGEKKPYFEGLPIPAAAGTMVAFILTFEDPAWFDGLAMGRLSVLIPVVVVLSALMLTDVQFDSFPKLNPAALKAHRWVVIFFFVGVLLTVFLQEVGLFIAATCYILFSVGRSTVRFSKAVWNAEVEGKG